MPCPHSVRRFYRPGCSVHGLMRSLRRVLNVLKVPPRVANNARSRGRLCARRLDKTFIDPNERSLMVQRVCTRARGSGVGLG